jgi:hypothetical protein
MRVKSHNWTNEELTLIHDTTFSVREVAEKLRMRIGTVGNKRKTLGIKNDQSAVMSKSRPNRIKNETRCCVGKDCNNPFVVKPAMKKKYCSHSCQLRTENVAKKGIGSRAIRNPNIKEYTKYARKVHGLSHKVYEQNKETINPNNHPRTLCGVDDGWQLDHIVTIKECFERNVSVEDASAVSNLRMLSWRDNLMRQYVN